jgi:hypothetical protein
MISTCSHEMEKYLIQQKHLKISQAHKKMNGQWSYMWGSNKYSSRQFYSIPFKALQPPAPFGWIWMLRI